MTSKDLSRNAFDSYMAVVKRDIASTESRMRHLDYTKAIARLTHKDWVRWQNSEIVYDEISKCFINKK